MYGKINTSYDDNKIECKDDFTSCRTNNCITKGKWCYEAILFSNGLFQIGWSQLNTPFTYFKGVGDDDSSYAYDGYRISAWNNININYGTIWDIGDVIGICIDLDNKCAEFFHNGQSQGIAFTEINIGKNSAYFPALTFSQFEKCFLNFGSLPFYYDYPSYNPLDIPKSKYNNNMEITMALLNLIQNLLFKLLTTETNTDTDFTYLKYILNQKLLSYLLRVSFEDFYLCRTLLFPFLFNVSKQNNLLFNLLINEMRINCIINRMDDFFNRMFDKLLNVIEETSIMSSFMIKEWKQYMTLFSLIIQNENIFIQWINGKDIIPQLKMLFNSNSLHIQFIDSYIKTQFENALISMSSSAILKVIMNKTDLFEKDFYNNEQVYQEHLSHFLSLFFFLADSTHSIPHCVSLLLRVIKEGYNIDCLYNVDLDSFCSSRNKSTSFLIKNFLFSNLFSFLEEYQNVPLNKFSILCDNVNNNSNISFFPNKHNENIGGMKIDNIIIDYCLNIDVLLRESEMIPSIKFHLILKTAICIQKYFQGYCLIYKASKGNKLDFKIEERGTTHLSLVFRTYFYLFNEECQKLLYKMAYFILKWFDWILTLGEQYIYCLPSSVTQIPFTVLKLLITFKSTILTNKEYRIKLNASSIHYSSDSFIEGCVLFYSRLFSIDMINNYNVILILFNNIKYFLSQPMLSMVIINNKTIINYINKGIKKTILSSISSEKQVKFLGNIILLHIYSNEKIFEIEEYASLINNNIITQFIHFIEEYSRNLNATMTNYFSVLDLCKELIIKEKCQNCEWFSMLTELKKSYKSLYKQILIYEFTITYLPSEFFEYKSLIWIQFKSFLVNLTSRILCEPYISELELYLLKYNNSKRSLIKIATIIGGIFICIKRNKQCASKCFSEMIKLVNFNIDSFDTLFKKIDPLLQATNNKVSLAIINKFKEITHYMKAEKSKQEMNKSNKKIKEEDLCILCYDLLSNRIFVPCGHIACNECLEQYLAEQDKCFICMSQIEKIINYYPH